MYKSALLPILGRLGASLLGAGKAVGSAAGAVARPVGAALKAAPATAGKVLKGIPTNKALLGVGTVGMGIDAFRGGQEAFARQHDIQDAGQSYLNGLVEGSARTLHEVNDSNWLQRWMMPSALQSQDVRAQLVERMRSRFPKEQQAYVAPVAMRTFDMYDQLRQGKQPDKPNMGQFLPAYMDMQQQLIDQRLEQLRKVQQGVGVNASTLQ